MKPRPAGNGEDDVAELRRRLDMAEDELTFLKAVFEEYKDSSGELELELDAQLKDLERSNLALKRENDQLRSQLQSTVMRSRKSAEEASNLTTALETHLEELTKREKKAQSKVRAMEQEIEQLKADTAKFQSAVSATAAPAQVNPQSVVSSAEFKALKVELDAAIADRAKKQNRLAGVKAAVSDLRSMITKLASLSQSRYATAISDLQIPQLPPEDEDDVEAIARETQDTMNILNKTFKLMEETDMASLLLKQVSDILKSPDNVKGTKLDGQSEVAISRSCLIILGRLMVLGDSLPQFKRSVNSLKTSLAEHFQHQSESGAQQLAHTVLMLAQDIMSAVFDPMREVGRDEELRHMKEDTLKKVEEARLEGERRAQIEADARIAREKAEAEKRVKDMEKLSLSAKMNLEETQRELDRVRAESAHQLQSARTEAKQLVEAAVRKALEDAAVSRKALEEEIYQSVAAEMDGLRDALERSEAQYKQAAMKQQMYQNSMKNAILDQSKAMLQAMANARKELETLKRSTQSELAETQKLLNHNLDHVRKVARTIAKSDIATLSMMYERELDLRVKLQDQVQALKGNIRVFCRIRPLLEHEIDSGEVEALQATNEMTVTAEDPDDPGQPQSFSFDRVFGPDDSQEVVFDEMRTLCLSAMDGYNVCLFAYGVTGSGKTFTVEGGEKARANPKLHGLVYRTLKELFRIAYGERAGAYETEISVQMMELYNEDFRDLLQSDPRAPRPEVRIIPEVGVIVDNVTRHSVVKLDDCMEIVKKGYSSRTTKSTNSNDVSSRSHSILTVILKGTNLRTKKSYAGKLHFVDLAGSERVGKSGVTGDALKEAQAINKSLSALGDVISALSQREKFVPFRNSQLTKLLQESLGGNSKTVMICNIAPCRHSMSETVATLRFATRAHKVEMGKATATEVLTETKEVKSIKNKMADLETKFKAGQRAAIAGGGSSGDLKPPTSARGRQSSPVVMNPPPKVGSRK